MKFFISIMIMLSSLPVRSETLSAKALFFRCYSQITQQRPLRNNPLLLSVQSGAKDPIAACLEILDSARFVDINGQRMVQPNNAVAQTVFDTFHRLHASWFSVKALPTSSEGRLYLNADVSDQSTPALYFDRALLDTNIPVNYTLKTSDNLATVRTDMDVPNGPFSNRLKSAYEYNIDPNFRFAPVGKLLGLYVTGPQVLNWQRLNLAASGTSDFGEHFGGGFLGNTIYMFKNIDELDPFRADGTIAMPRKFSRSVFLDAFCRELPVVRSTDVAAFVAPTAYAEFRKSAACVKCHASMDRMASTIRWFSFRKPGKDLNQAMFVAKAEVTQPPESAWPVQPDSLYPSRPPNGVLYFRNYNGDLVDINVNGLSDLGNKIAEQDDFYMCIAKRYYKYFTGINVETGDIADPHFGRTLTSVEMSHRQTVVQLGKALKGHQSLRQLIESVMRLPLYTESNFSIASEK